VQLLHAARTPGERILLMTLYASGARNAELTDLKISDIDSQRMVVHIRGGKGRKDRLCAMARGIDAAWSQYLLPETSSEKDDQLNRLWHELNSASAEASVVYRTAVENAIVAFPAQELRKGAGGQASIDRIRKAAAGWLDEKVPHHRIAAARILFHLDVQIDVAKSDGTLPN